MHIFISPYFNKIPFGGAICTTADYNIAIGIKSLLSDNKNIIIIGEDFFQKKNLENFENLKKYCKNEIKSITYIQGSDVKYNPTYPSYIKQFRYIVDLHGWGDLSKSSNGKLNLLLPYAYCYNYYKNSPVFKYTHTDNLYFLPHSVVFKTNINKNPINKILLSGRGRKNSSKYPMRVFFYNISQKDNRIEYLKPDHGYKVYEKNIKGKDTFGQKYINKLNEYIACLADDSIHYSPYILAKFFEILSSGSLLVACLQYTKIYFEQLGFIENQHYISITKDNYDEKIKYILDPKNRKSIDKIRLNGYNLCNKYHTSKYRALQLLEILNNTENVIKYNNGIEGTSYHLVKNMNIL